MVTVPISNYVTENGTYSLELISTELLRFASKENANQSYWPILEITYEKDLPTPTPAPVTVTFAPIADSYVAQNYPDTNHGNYTELHVNANTTYTKYTYLKFDVSGVTGTIQSAKLKLKATYVGGEGTNTVWGNSDTTWTESEITWNNKPLNITNITTVDAPTTVEDWMEADITSYVTGNGTYSLQLIPSDINNRYASKEDSTQSNRPVLEVIYIKGPQK